MKRHLAVALGTLSLAWFTTCAHADPIASVKTDPAVVRVDAAAALPAAPAPVVVTPNPAADACYHTADCCDPKGGFTAGAAFYYLKPHFDGNTAFTSTTSTAIGQAGMVQDFNSDYSFSPLLWAGFSGADGLGARVRWFRFDQSSNPLSFSQDIHPGTTITSATPLGLAIPNISAMSDVENFAFTSDLQVQSWDFEATQAFGGDRWSLLLAGGVRYAHLSQNYSASIVDPTVATSESLLSGHNFNGVGPEAAIEVWRNIGSTNFALYASARGGLLFGESKHSVTETVDPALVTTPTTAFANHDQSMPFVEFEVGGEYGRNIGRGRAFVQAALVGQEWFGAGNASFDGPVVTRAITSDTMSNLGLFGFKVAAGIRF